MADSLGESDKVLHKLVQIPLQPSNSELAYQRDVGLQVGIIDCLYPTTQTN